METRIKVFFSYAREDEALRDKLEEKLSNLKQRGEIEFWSDLNISPGMKWAREITKHLDTANIILLLVSPDFMDSENCQKEMTRAIKKYKPRKVRVIPIILQPVPWRQAPFSKLQALPTDGKPITSWPNLGDALSDVASGIQKVVEELALELGLSRRERREFLKGLGEGGGWLV